MISATYIRLQTALLILTSVLGREMWSIFIARDPQLIKHHFFLVTPFYFSAVIMTVTGTSGHLAGDADTCVLEFYGMRLHTQVYIYLIDIESECSNINSTLNETNSQLDKCICLIQAKIDRYIIYLFYFILFCIKGPNFIS